MPRDTLPNSVDREAMMTSYEAFGEDQKLPNTPAKTLMDHARYRIYTEWCMQTPWSQHGLYKGQAFDEWLRDETHFALERAGFQWNRERGCFEPDDEVRAVYSETRRQVCEAAMRRTVEFLRACEEGNWWPKKGDHRNLRGSLQPYLEHEKPAAE